MKRLVTITILTIFTCLLVAIPVTAQEIDGSDPRDTDLVYLEIRADLDETEITGRGAPTQVYIHDVFTGYSLPVWSDPSNLNEELYYSICVPDRWNESTDIVVEVTTVLSDAGEKGNTYQIDLAWDKVTPNAEVVPAGFHSVSAIRYNVSDLQYFCYRDYFVIDYDAPADDPIIHDDDLNFRLRLGQVGGQYTDLDGELIILHVGVLFPRGDLLGDPEDGVFEIIDEWMEENMTELVITLESGVIALQALWIFIPLIFLSVLAWWWSNSVIFMITGGVAIMTGLYAPDVISPVSSTSPFDITVTLSLIAYGLCCWGLAFACMFWSKERKQ